MRTPVLRVVQSVEGTDVVVRVSGPLVPGWAAAEQQEIWRASEATVDRINAELAADLHQVMNELRASEDCDARRSATIFGEYVRSAHEYWSDSDLDTPAHVVRRRTVSNALASAGARLRSQARTDALAAARHAPVVEFRSTRRSPVPLELLPLGDRPLRGHTLWQSCFALPAFAAIIRRVYFRSEVDAVDAGRSLIDPDVKFQQAGRAFFRSEATKLWRKMERYFDAELPNRTFAPLPRVGVVDSREAIAAYLLDPQPVESLPGAGNKISDIHVYAHGEIGDSRKERVRLRFDFNGKLSPREAVVRWIDFRDAISDMEGRGLRRTVGMIWLNCCNAAGVIGQELSSLSVDLSRFGCFVIAPRTEVPEGFAIAFAQDFYRILDAHSVPEEAFLAARLTSVEKRNNPLGALYTALGGLS